MSASDLSIIDIWNSNAGWRGTFCTLKLRWDNRYSPAVAIATFTSNTNPPDFTHTRIYLREYYRRGLIHPHTFVSIIYLIFDKQKGWNEFLSVVTINRIDYRPVLFSWTCIV